MSDWPKAPTISKRPKPVNPSDFMNNEWLYAWTLASGLMAAQKLSFEEALTAALLKVEHIRICLASAEGRYPLLDNDDFLSYIERDGSKVKAVVTVRSPDSEPKAKVFHLPDFRDGEPTQDDT